MHQEQLYKMTLSEVWRMLFLLVEVARMLSDPWKMLSLQGKEGLEMEAKL